MKIKYEPGLGRGNLSAKEKNTIRFCACCKFTRGQEQWKQSTMIVIDHSTAPKHISQNFVERFDYNKAKQRTYRNRILSIEGYFDAPYNPKWDIELGFGDGDVRFGQTH